MSIGVSSLRTNHAGTADQLVAQADGALYKSKQLGRNRVSVSDSRSTVSAA
jgi:PleD family two-component response regulator